MIYAMGTQVDVYLKGAGVWDEGEIVGVHLRGPYDVLYYVATQEHGEREVEARDVRPQPKHDEACQKVRAERRAWIARWPRHCRACEGLGGFHHPSTYYEPEDYDVCSCMDQGTCPRCGEQGWSDSEEEDFTAPCKHCGWVVSDPDTCPPACVCDPPF